MNTFEFSSSFMIYSVQVWLTDSQGWVTHSHIQADLHNFTKTAKMCRDYIRSHISRGGEAYFEVFGWDSHELHCDLEYKETVYCSNKTGKIHFRINQTSRKKEYAHELGLSWKSSLFKNKHDPRQMSLQFTDIE